MGITTQNIPHRHFIGFWIPDVYRRLSLLRSGAFERLTIFHRTFSATIYIPGIQDVSREFQVSRVAATVPFPIFVLGYAFGPIIAAPCSETFGRRVVYRACIPFYAVFILGSGLARTFPTLVICRFLAGLFGSPSLSIGSGTIADIWKPEDPTVPMVAFIAAPFVGPTMGYVSPSTDFLPQGRKIPYRSNEFA